MRQQAGRLKRELETRPDVEKVKLRLGGGGVLDVFVDGRMVFSKKQAGRMPTAEEILKAARAG